MSVTGQEAVVWVRHNRLLIAVATLAVLWAAESLAPMFAGRTGDSTIARRTSRSP
ncbi:MAG: hypothetical protein ABI680_14975 [Chthoniobacteraceae bacterium]